MLAYVFIILFIFFVIMMVYVGFIVPTIPIGDPIKTKIIDIRNNACIINVEGHKDVIQNIGDFNCMYYNIGDNVTIQKHNLPMFGNIWNAVK